ncbi:hypothetical protein PIB30_085922 [Stylosanthes scabra]|uniref:Uncharacterized protein n=1 Tax=Stylosanthes scabra TaxID=79078 RepID=A0ABU6UVP5_9FABA|nr:hypothetical protein [Stylosanthes scabra]
MFFADSEVDEIFHFIHAGRRRSKSDGSGDSGAESMSKKELALQQALDQITSAQVLVPLSQVFVLLLLFSDLELLVLLCKNF